MGTYEDLVAEGAAAPVEGWDFSWLEGRATEQRPSWGYQRTIADRLPRVAAALDVQTGGGEVLAGVPAYPPVMVATEGWPPNAARAARLLRPRGVAVVAVADAPAFPFADARFDLVTSRHPVRPWWAEIARVLRPGGRYLAQHVGPASMLDLIEWMRGPLPAVDRHDRDPEVEAAQARAAGLEVLDVRCERLRVEFFDIAAVVHLLRKVIWWVPDFDVERDDRQLRGLHDRIRTDGSFVAWSSRVLIEARRPG
ncbi:class I SAM-dependent methyltransferase [Pseudonocardia humida]|uniref:Methyltransferase domain-containing protein n=1 Tax=Pseudonocardia humida TaxID=2800819 RepID=A0ABT1A6K4_9PSEU|nr:methyltransferase domain-containing protein [Pseudonocardia humida]MCO1658645.1 methyltransferase domain-containing protein [Pseudonocardia humida]